MTLWVIISLDLELTSQVVTEISIIYLSYFLWKSGDVDVAVDIGPFI